MIELVPNPTWLDGVHYDLVTRRHTLDGARVPSATQILDLAFPNRYAGVRADVLARKAQIGTAVHHAAHYHAENDLDEASLLAAMVRIKFEAWKWFCSKRQVRALLCESVVCFRDLRRARESRRPYIGKIDFLTEVDRKLLVLLDIKTGKPDLAHIQTSLYLDALYEQYPILRTVPILRWAIETQETGQYRIHPYPNDRYDRLEARRALEHAYLAPDAEWRTPTMVFDMHNFAPLDPPLPEPFPDPVLEAPLPDPMPEPTLDAPLPEPSPEPVFGAPRLVYSAPAPSPQESLEAIVASLDTETERGLTTQASDLITYAQTAPIDTPAQLADLGRFGVQCKEAEAKINGFFDPIIQPIRLALERLYERRRPLLAQVQQAANIALRRYDAEHRRLQVLEQQRKADELAIALKKQEEERARLAKEAQQALQLGDMETAVERTTQASQVPLELPTDPAPTPATSGKAAGVAKGKDHWIAEVHDRAKFVDAVMRPWYLLEFAEFLEGQGDRPVAQIAMDLRRIASELPRIDKHMVEPSEVQLKLAATMNKDTLTWPGVIFRNVPQKPAVRPRSTR